MRGLASAIASTGYQALVPLVAREGPETDEVGFGLLPGSFGVMAMTATANADAMLG